MQNVAAGKVDWWRRGRRIAADVARGLAFLHGRRIVHFDLKSPNILLARDGTAKIADAGMARFLAADYVTGVVATFAWSAPEVRRRVVNAILKFLYIFFKFIAFLLITPYF